MVVGDFNGDGRLDLAAEDMDGGSVAVLLGNGDGTFQPPAYYTVGTTGLGPAGTPPGGNLLVAGDFGNGHLDLAVADYEDNDISVLLGNGDGTFQPRVTYAVGTGPWALVAADFTGNGRLDLAVADAGGKVSGGTDPGGVSVLLGNGDGTFEPAKEYEAGNTPVALVAGDFNDDGRLDLAVADQGGWPLGSDPGGVSVLLGDGDGTFQPPVTSRGAITPGSIVAGDFTGDGKLDLATITITRVISVLPGDGDGTFGAPQKISTLVEEPFFLVSGDFNRDGRVDLATADYITNDIDVLLGKGDGTFVEPQGTRIANNPSAMVTGDFNGDGRLDLVTGSGDLTVLLGDGGGTFQPAKLVAAGIAGAMVAGDFNGDGRLDLAVSVGGGVRHGGEVAVLLGNGDGTFQPPTTYPVGVLPGAIVAGDFNGDGRTDLAVADSGNKFFKAPGGVSVLLGNGDGTFRNQGLYVYQVGASPGSMAAGDFNGDGRTDLAIADSHSNTISVLLSDGDGTFRPAVSRAVGSSPQILAGDFNGDGHLDLVVATSTSGTQGYTSAISLLLGDGDGTFQPATSLLPSLGAPDGYYVLAGDFNGDGHLDLMVDRLPLGGLVGKTLIRPASTFSVFLGDGDGTFQPPVNTAAPYYVNLLVGGDFNGDGKSDLAVADYFSHAVSVVPSDGGGSFADPGQSDTVLLGNPLVAAVNGDGTDDVLIVDGAGDILYRQGIPGQPGTFEPPVTVNPGFPSRDIAWVPDSREGPLLASVDARDNAVSLYAWRDGGFVRVGSLATGSLPAQVIAADLDGTGFDDLVVHNAGDGTLFVYANAEETRSHVPGALFVTPLCLTVGPGVSDVQAVYNPGDDRRDLVVTNKLTGQLGILPNWGNHVFSALQPYRAGTGLSAVGPGSTPELAGSDATTGVAAGPLTLGGPNCLVTINPGTNTLSVLAVLGGNVYAHPVTIDTPSPALAIREADFNHDGNTDLAVLTTDGVSIYLGDGQGGFLRPTTYAVPPEADGLTVADLLSNGKLDLLIGDAYGDVLVLVGVGDGTFQRYREANQTIDLAVADLTGNGSKDIIYADQGLDRVVVDYGAGNSSVLADQSTGLLQPGAVALADLNGDGIPDLIVANSDSNNVLIYPGLGNGQFGPAINNGNGYFVGDNPVGITVADLTGDLPDLVVADEGSNQVSILINGSQKGGAISLSSGARLNAGGNGPVSTIVGHFAGGTYPDLLVTNSQSNDVTLLPGVGAGFFNDQNPRIYSVGTDPVASFVGSFNGQTDLLTVNSGSNDLTIISGFEGPSPLVTTIASGGVDPTAAFEFGAAGGFEDLVVGNTGDGALALFEGGPEGLSLFSTAEEPNLPDPTALAFSALTGGEVQFYAATAGRESAELVALSLSFQLETTSNPPGGGSTVIETVMGSSLLLALPPSTATVQLVALNETSLPLVATVLTLTISGAGAELDPALVETEAIGVVATVAGPATSAGQGLVSTSRGGEATAGPTEESGESGAAATAAPAVLAPWERFVLGLDRALEELGRENSGGIISPPPAAAAPSPVPAVPAQGGGPGLQSVPVRPSGAEPDDPDPSQAPGPGLAIVDGWHDRVHEGMPGGAGGAPLHDHVEVGRPPGRLRLTISGTAGEIDAAITRPLSDRSAPPHSVIDRPKVQPVSDGPRLASACLALSLLTAPWDARRSGTGPRSIADRPARAAFRRRR
jgi:hypothetical protein